MDSIDFMPDERAEALALAGRLMRLMQPVTRPGDTSAVRRLLQANAATLRRDRFGLHPVLRHMHTAILLAERLSPDRNMALALMLYEYVRTGAVERAQISADWGEDVAHMVDGLLNVATLYSRKAAVETDNFRKLLLTFADDIRVIIIMIVDRLALMQAINHHPDAEAVRHVAAEASYLYAPLAHRLGLYAIKGELEDLAFKYSNREMFTRIARKLNQTKTHREKYIADFIEPVRRRLKAEGLNFEIKGRTKSISSIWNKMKKQKNDLDEIYDLFAIRIILDVPPELEKNQCWLVYSIVTDMYRPNPARMKDWISIPKSNGYESLHITVYGPEERWVEVQIRTRRMDLVAEKGLAAHWRYKGIKSEGGLDTWMNNVRDILEAGADGPLELMKNMRMDVYDKEVFVFTPKGDLYKLPMGATLLDFAFSIHSSVGSHCTGGRVNGKNQRLTYRLRSGDTVEIFTAQSQTPKTDWLNIAVTSKARNKIRVALKELAGRRAELGKELLQRRFKNRKIDIDDPQLSRAIVKTGYKNITDFYTAIADEKLDVNDVIDLYTSFDRTDDTTSGSTHISASEYVMPDPLADAEHTSQSSDILVIGDNIKGINYRMARCCNPIFGDDVFGFVSSEGVIKIHRNDCPNADNIRRNYPYRLIRTRWSGKNGSQFAATLRIVGQDELGIITNLTSIINKEKNSSLRSISIDSNDGLFQGFVVVGVSDTSVLNQLIKKIKTVKGIKDVQRSK
ncbi:MAG: bifunctional (p)ppGpp synthetase/guanosine-3',5'-bis(diphosphate) 3'-pyrophosphohydrolase [Muribaculaceae bacterium]|nr:bifunctional (p)ppGpp synthetase/guanosine-3',5'-bis(diphosphate) 3'-pyrophosphohydrolase [Muribaculaceae bacterium]